MNCKVDLLKTFVITILLLLVNKIDVNAQAPTNLSQYDATQLAEDFVLNHTDRLPVWKNAVLEDPVLLYNLTGEPSAFIFSISNRSIDAGYVTVSIKQLPNPILEYSTHPSPLKNSKSEIEAVKRDNQLTIDFEKPLYLGPLSYYYRATSPTGPVAVEIASQEIFPISDSDVQSDTDNNWNLITTADLSEIKETITPQVVSQFMIYGPDYFWYRGCGPTAAANAIGYYADRGFPNLISGGSQGNFTAAIDELANLMGTSSQGLTYLPISDDMRNYAARHGYQFASNEYYNPNFQILVNEVNIRHPVVVLVNGHIEYGDHFITAFGYEYDPSNTNYRYMIVHDTWGDGDYAVQFGTGYSRIWFTTIYPTSGSILVDNTPPTSMVNALPEYSLPGMFQVSWNGSDNSGGLGIDSYDIQYKDGEVGVWTDLVTQARFTNINFWGEIGHAYYFRSRAIDKDRNIEAYPPSEDGDTHISIVSYVFQGMVMGNTDKPVLNASVQVLPKGTPPTKSNGSGWFQVGFPDDGPYEILVVSDTHYDTIPSMRNLRYSNNPEIHFYLPPANNLITNGGFESPDLSSWITSGNLPPSSSTISVHTGGNSLMMGGLAPSDNSGSVLQQTITIPGDMEKPVLSFLSFVPFNNALMSSHVHIIDGTDSSDYPIVINSFGYWDHHWIDMSSYSGKTITVEFDFNINSTAQTAEMYLDEVSLGSEVGGVKNVYLPSIIK